MKMIGVIGVGLLLAGCSGLKGTMMDGSVCTIASSDAIGAYKDHVIDSYVDKDDQKKAQLYASTAKLTATAWCEVARARDAARANGQ